MLQLITGIGIGSIIAAAIGWRVAILNLRQASINALRDDLATYLKELEVMHYTIGKLLAAGHASSFEELERQKHEARVRSSSFTDAYCCSWTGPTLGTSTLLKNSKHLTRLRPRFPTQTLSMTW
jgi:hypothetical protein